jgi:SAM-dependent methyltransferase
MRLSADGSGEEISAALRALRWPLGTGTAGEIGGAPFPETDARLGYREWADTYDQPGNPLIALEEQVMAPLLARCPPGAALDVAAGTGRHARRLACLGHRVTAVDTSVEMLARLEGRGIRAFAGDMTALPVRDAAFDLAVCSLALTHASALDPPLREMGRVVHPGGAVVISDIHPLIAALGGHAYYRTAAGDMRFVRNHVWWPSDYLAAFAAAGLEVVNCHEPRLGAPEGVPHFLESPPPNEDAVARVAFRELPGAIIWELRRPLWERPRLGRRGPGRTPAS